MPAARENPAKGQGGNGSNQYTKAEEESKRQNLTFEQHRNSNDHMLRRLARDRPDILDRVETGELTPNAAAIEAGFRKRKVQVEPTPDAVQRMLDKHMPGWRLMNEETGETA